jgi:radical SAM modification target selenobiotic family peptide
MSILKAVAVTKPAGKELTFVSLIETIIIIIKILRRRYLMNQKDFKKILAGFGITALVAGVTLAGVGYPEPAQAA